MVVVWTMGHDLCRIIFVSETAASSYFSREEEPQPD